MSYLPDMRDVVVNNYQRLIEVAKAFGKTVSEGMLENWPKACELDEADDAGRMCTGYQ